MGRNVVRYSEAFKLHVVESLDSGELRSFSEASVRYGIKGAMTVGKWVRKYGKVHLLPRVVRVETENEKATVLELKKELRRLREALGQSHMETSMYRSWFEISCREFGVADVEGFKKKHAERL